jgi:NAD(P)H dehydrogenase (quinone)
MRVLVVQAHPDQESLSGALFQAVRRGLGRAGHLVDVIDLYGDGFRAFMSADERRAYETDQPIIDPQVQRYVDLLLAADALVFVYPTWNMGLPAILKAWIERVLLPGVAFSLDQETNRVKGGLGHLRRLVGVSTYGLPRSAVFVTNDAGRRLITRGVRGMCSKVKCRTTWMGLYGLNRPDSAAITEFIGRVEREMAQL